jgi:Tol biopolymer transport system component
MAGFGLGVNRWIAAHKTDLTAAATTPDKTKSLIVLPGTIYLSQNGVLYAFNSGRFTAINAPKTDSLGETISWSQPTILPNGNLLAVMRGSEYSDLYELTPQGGVVAQLTHDYVGNNPDTIRSDHWIEWPRLSPDGQTLFFSLDSPKLINSYEVDFNIWSTPITTPSIVTANKYNADGKIVGTHWTTPEYYTGGDTDPMPLKSGALLYVAYSVTSADKATSTLDLQATPRAQPIQLTTSAQDCNAAVLSPDETEVAMVCSNDSQQTEIEVASFNGTTLGTPVVVVQNCLCASPQWRPDGGGLIYVAPSDNTGHFQLWWLANAGSAKPAQPELITNNLDFDAASVPSWSLPTPQVTSPASPS